MEGPNLKGERSIIFLIGMVSAFFLVGIIFIIYISSDLTRSNQALVLATAIGSLGTFLLALATFYNIIQTNRRLQMEEKGREKPLVVDELSTLLQPAIISLESNLQEMERSENKGCAFDWVYIDASNFGSFTMSAGPEPVRTPDSLPMARLFVEDRQLFGALRAHNGYVERVAEEATKFHEEMKPEIQRLLDEEGIKEINQSLQVFSSSVLRNTLHFGESHELYDFWEKHRDHLIRYGNEIPEVTQDEIQAAERAYRDMVEDTLSDLKQRKAMLKNEYGISENEIIVEKDNVFERDGI